MSVTKAIGYVCLCALGADIHPLFAQNRALTSYRSTEAGFQIDYPEGWTVVVARFSEGKAAREEVVLLDGEIFKVAFVESGDPVWPGRFESRILANPDHDDLNRVLSDFDLTDIWENPPSDTLLAKYPAKTWIRWGYENLMRECLLILPRGVAHIRFEVSNPNNPAMAEHKLIYDTMASSFEIIGDP